MIKLFQYLCFFTLFFIKITYASNTHFIGNNQIKVGAEQTALYLPLLKGKRVGLVVNQTSRLTNSQGYNVHLVDHLIANNISVRYIFAPEHGFRGDHDAGAKVANNIDVKTGIAVISLYGKTRKPTPEIMAQLDVIIFDIQDVGVRYYTYISSMHYVMEAAAEAGIEFMVLDRPNPNISLVDGPMLEPQFSSFVGLDTIPLLHGMTVGELAQMIKGEHWLASEKTLKLIVIAVANYSRNSLYILPIKPSPNLPNQSAIYLYPQLGFFEATTVSVGRGTPFPFQVIGHDKVKLGNFTFMPISIKGAALKPKLMNKQLFGQDFRGIKRPKFDLKTFMHVYQQFKQAGVKFINRPKFLDKLAGTDKFRKALQAGKSLTAIKQSWQQALNNFKKQRQVYLLYY
ncbi:MAG: DUF1343 domain-containing protein [Alteromonadaceae bacterium]|nr:DUF1343 domain-containing protein [Alteromonadaceae bacterium]